MNRQNAGSDSQPAAGIREPHCLIGDVVVFLPESRRLVIRGQAVAVRPQLCELLLLLVENHGRVVHIEDAIRHLWGTHETGSPHQLQGMVLELRNVLGRERRMYIETVRNAGYKLAAPVRFVPAKDEELQPRPGELISRVTDVYTHPSGRFEKDGEIWKEYRNDLPEPKYTFKEHWRDQDYIYLYDETRKRDPGRFMLLRLPIRGGVAQWGYPNPVTWEDLTIVKPERSQRPKKRPPQRVERLNLTPRSSNTSRARS